MSVVPYAMALVAAAGMAAQAARGDGGHPATASAPAATAPATAAELQAHAEAEDQILRTMVNGHTWHYWVRTVDAGQAPQTDASYGSRPGEKRYEVVCRLLTLARPAPRDLSADSRRQQWFTQAGLGVVVMSTAVEAHGEPTYTWKSLRIVPGELFETREFVDDDRGQRLVQRRRTPTQTTTLAYDFGERPEAMVVTFERRANSTNAILERKQFAGGLFKTLAAAEHYLRPELELMGLPWADLASAPSHQGAAGASAHTAATAQAPAWRSAIIWWLLAAAAALLAAAAAYAAWKGCTAWRGIRGPGP